MDLSTTEKLTEYVKICEEVALFMLIDSMGCLAWRLNHDARRDGARGYLTVDQTDAMFNDVDKLQKQIAICAAHVARFGVSMTLSDKGFVTPSPEYWLWYHWWKDYINALSNADFRLLDNDLSQDSQVSSLSKWQPPGTWQTKD